MMPFLALHGVAAQRGDGLRPELVALMQRSAQSPGNYNSPISQELGEALPDFDAFCALTSLPEGQ